MARLALSMPRGCSHAARTPGSIGIGAFASIIWEIGCWMAADSYLIASLSLLFGEAGINDLLRGHDLQRGPPLDVFVSRTRRILYYSMETEKNSHHLLAVKPPRSQFVCAARLGEAGSLLANRCGGNGATADDFDRDCFRGRKFSKLWPALPGSCRDGCCERRISADCHTKQYHFR